MKPPTSLFDRLIGHPRYPWIAIGLSTLLFLAPFLVAFAGDELGELLSGGQWRGLLIPPTIIAYILLIAPRMTNQEARVLESLRSIILIDDESFGQIVEENATIRLRNELIALGSGILLGFLSGMVSLEGAFSWLGLIWFLSTGLMYGLLLWAIYVSVVSSRVIAALLRQPLHVDPFDVTPFEAVGRQGLLIALVFVGGITISLLLVAFEPEVFLRPEFWLIYIPLALVPVMLFFLTMYPTHRVIAAAKNRELADVQRHLQHSCRSLLARRDEGQSTDTLPAEINALAAYETLLQKTRTWPYNTAMLRTLFFSVLIPGGTILGRALVEVLFD
jgi:hypothetical protein